MALKKHIIPDSFKKSISSFVTITPDAIIFSAGFVSLAHLRKKAGVEVFTDNETRSMYFRFDDEKKDDDNCLTLIFKEKEREIGHIKCSNRYFVSSYDWIDKVSKLEGRHRRFTPKKTKGLWKIILCPTLERKTERISKKIKSSEVGIYQYRRSASDEIVYIGRGVIRGRENERKRKDWDYDIVEYSIVEKEEDRIYWENYWLKKFKDEHDGKLPLYNKNSGSGKYREK